MVLDVPDVLRAAIRLTASEVRHRAQLVCELGPIPQVIADDGRLTQVFIDLIINAAHAIPEGRSDTHRITVRTTSDGDGRAVVEISDTGRGMTAEVQARAFEPGLTTQPPGAGTGPGLASCHGVVSGLGGAISIDSAPDRGTTIRVVLPAVPAPPTASALPELRTSEDQDGKARALPELRSSEDQDGKARALLELRSSEDQDGKARALLELPRRPRVLVVDDEPQVADMLARVLRREYDVTVAGCGQAALDQIVGGARFDAIVSDVMMPNMSGIELLEELMGFAPDQASRLVFLSGGVFPAQTRARIDELGMVQLEKPIGAQELRSWVARIVSGQLRGGSRGAVA